MKRKFVKTENVKKLITLMNNLQNRADGVPRMALVYGEPGLGKTHSVIWWAMQNNAVFIRCANLMSPRWLLEELAEELGEIPHYKVSDLFNQVVSKLIQEPQVLIIDEIDYLVSNARTIETIRDIYDKTNVPVLLIGMGKANRKLLRYKHLFDRFLDVLKYEPFGKADIAKIIEELSEVKMTECAKNLIFNKTNRFRQIVKLINKSEQVAKANGLNSVDELTLKEFLNDEISNQDKDI